VSRIAQYHDSVDKLVVGERREMGELEASVGRMKSDLQGHDMNGAWQEFQKEILHIERQPNSQKDKAQQEAAYLSQVIKECDELKKLGFPSATFHQNGRSLEFLPNDTSSNIRWGTASLTFTAFTDSNANKKSHDLSVDETKATLNAQQGSDGVLRGGVKDTGFVIPDNTKGPYSAGADANGDPLARSEQPVRPPSRQEAIDQTIGWNNWAHGIQSFLQASVAGDQNLVQQIQNKNGSLRFDFTVDNAGNIYHVYVQDSNGNREVSKECTQLVQRLTHTNTLQFPEGTQYRVKPFSWSLPYGPNVINGSNFQNIPDEHHRIPVKTY